MNRPSRHLDLRTSRLLTLPTDPWLSCEDCFRLLDAYVDLPQEERDAAPWAPLRVHLDGCPACADEAESLLELLALDEVEQPPR